MADKRVKYIADAGPFSEVSITAAPAAAAVFEFDLYELGLLPATAPFPIV